MTNSELLTAMVRGLVRAEGHIFAARDELEDDSPIKRRLTAALGALADAHDLVEDRHPGLICSCMYEVYPLRTGAE